MQHPNLPLALYYHVSVDNDMPYNICGGLQDNYNWCGPSATRFSRGIKNSDWYQVQGGDGFVVLTDPRDSRYVYSESQDGNIQRKNKITGEARNIRPNFQNIIAGAGRRRAAVPLELGHADGVLADTIRRRCSSPPTRCSGRTIAAIRGRRSART